MTKCKRCGRELKNQESIKLELGKTCALAMGIKKEKTIKQKINKFDGWRKLDEWIA